MPMEHETLDPINLIQRPSLLDGQYEERRRTGNAGLPLFGYRLDEDDPRWSIAIPERLEYLRQALLYIEKGFSQRRVAAWLEHMTGETYHHTTLRWRYNTELRLSRTRKSLRAISSELEGSPLTACRSYGAELGAV